ncbi:MAG: tetratricopeptide repeat protein [Pirellulales bacterium]|nr:tetratricopeptide repeat protein [Pirellulales bacterium]
MIQPSATSRRRQLTALVLFAATAAVYAPVWNNQFVHFDDDVYLTANPHVQQGLTAEAVKWCFTSAYASNWHPLTWLSHLLDWQLFGANALGHHLVNVLLHAINTVLVFLVLERITRPRSIATEKNRRRPDANRNPGESTTSSANLWRAALVAALFCLHPLRVESVAWAAERKDTLSALFWWLTIGAYASYTASPNWRRYGLVLLGLLGGLLAKPAVVTLPVVLLLLDCWPLDRFAAAVRDTRTSWQRAWRLVLEKLPLAALCAASSAVTIWAQRRGGSLSAVEHLPLAYRIANALLAYVRYLELMFWPRGLACYYPHPKPDFDMHGPWQPRVLLAGGLLAALSIVAVWFGRRRRYLLVGWFWYLITLLPMIGLVQVGRQALADRYSYLPSVGIALAVVWLAGDWLESAPGVVRRWFGVPVAIAITALAALTVRQVAVWRDDLSLFKRAVSVTDDNDVALHNLGAALLLANRPAEAAPYLREAIRVRPDYATACRLLAIALAQQDQGAEAIRWYRETLRWQPASIDAATELAWLYATHPDARLRDPAQALQLAGAVVQSTGERSYPALDALAAAFAENGRFDEAAHVADQAAQVAASAGDANTAHQIAARAARYRARQPYRESPTQMQAE